METTLPYMINYLNSFFGFIWLPIVIWSFLAGLIWLFMKNSKQLHPQYHYQVRLGILFSLPAGLLMLAAIRGFENLFRGTEEPINLALFTVSYPVDVSITPVQNQSLFSTTEILALFLFGLYTAGVLFTLIKISLQWLKLRSLRSTHSLQFLFSLNFLDSENRKLIKSIKKPVFILFVDEAVIPVTFGYQHPVLVLPRSLRSDAEKCNLVIRHELTHISQNDFITHLLVVVTKAIFWFHPLIHKLHNEIIEYRELRCDSLILSEESVSRKKYAQLLLELLPLPNINKELSVNMAQESSNLKKRIQMITQSHYKQKHSKRVSLAIFSSILMITVFAMACTDMQTENVFNDEDEISNLMTDIDRTGERGFHEIVIFRGENGEMESHQGKIDNLENLPPDIIKSIDVFKGEKAVELYGEQGKHGVIVIKTHTDPTAYNTAMKALGMEADMPPPPPRPNEEPDVVEGYFIVVEEMPQIIGGMESIMSEVQYPEMARRAGIEGRVFVQFVVNEEGNVEDAEVVRGIGGGADEEALRVVRQAKFEPGVQRGRPVRVKYSLPIMFKLGNDESLDQNQTGIAEVEQPTTIAKRMTVEVQNDNGTLRGRVLDGETNRPLPGANIIVAGTNTGSTTDLDGSFAIRTDGSDDIELIFSYVGYERSSMSITR